MKQCLIILIQLFVIEISFEGGEHVNGRWELGPKKQWEMGDDVKKKREMGDDEQIMGDGRRGFWNVGNVFLS